MRLPRRIAAAVGLILAFRRPRPICRDELARADFSTSPGRKGLTFNRLLRDRLRGMWLRLLK